MRRGRFGDVYRYEGYHVKTNGFCKGYAFAHPIPFASNGTAQSLCCLRAANETLPDPICGFLPRTEKRRGSWHGDVLIYTFPYCQEEKEVEGFWDEVANLSLIRHENIMLFMGACVEPDHLSVITSMKMAKSLFESVHMERKNLSLMEKINVAQEISQVRLFEQNSSDGECFYCAPLSTADTRCTLCLFRRNGV